MTGDERLEKAEEVIRETTAQLIVGIRNTLNLYDVDHAGGTISGVVLTGTGARLIGLPPVLASSINKVVRIGDPFIRFRLSKEVERQNIMAHAIDLGAVLGLVIGKKRGERTMSRKNHGSMKQIGSSHRGRRGKIKDNPNPETSDGEKTSILSMNISDIGKALRASSSKTSKKADLPAEWNVRANLLPRSIVTLNRDRAIKYLLSYVLIVVVAAIAISAGMAVRVSWADHRVEEAQAKTLSLQKEKAEFKDVEDTFELAVRFAKVTYRRALRRNGLDEGGGFAQWRAASRRPVHEPVVEQLPDWRV